MTRDEFDAYCAILLHATHVVQWGDASVWKVGGKVFAVGGWSDPGDFAVTFKCSATSFAILKGLPGLRPAPYLGSRGLSWIQRTGGGTLSDRELAEYVQRSYALIWAALPRTTKRDLEINHRD
jgi:predicted DNA-binding protein (MmcQ/YjbR family)